MFSKNAAGIVVLALSLFGAEVTESGVMEVITALGTIASFVLLVINQLGRSDVERFFWKK